MQTNFARIKSRLGSKEQLKKCKYALMPQDSKEVFIIEVSCLFSFMKSEVIAAAMDLVS
jgi:hypothetical protein